MVEEPCAVFGIRELEHQVLGVANDAAKLEWLVQRDDGAFDLVPAFPHPASAMAHTAANTNTSRASFFVMFIAPFFLLGWYHAGSFVTAK